MNIVYTKERKKEIVKDQLNKNFVENFETFESSKNDIIKYIKEEFNIDVTITYNDFCSKLLDESLKLIDSDEVFANTTSFVAKSIFNLIISYLPNDDNILEIHKKNYKMTEILLITDSLKNKK